MAHLRRPRSAAHRLGRGRPLSAELESRDPAGAGPPGGTPYTVYFPSGDAYAAADLSHPTSLPCVGDRLDYLDEEGIVHRYRVREVVHILQAAPGLRPRVGFARTAASDEGAASRAPRTVPEAPEVRSGLPKVFLEALDPQEG